MLEVAGISFHELGNGVPDIQIQDRLETLVFGISHNILPPVMDFWIGHLSLAVPHGQMKQIVVRINGGKINEVF